MAEKISETSGTIMSVMFSKLSKPFDVVSSSMNTLNEMISRQAV
jgi:hypothetical protein